MNCKKLVCVLLFVAATIGSSRWLFFASGQRGIQSYARVVVGMTVEEVRLIMGREEDQPDERKTTTGEFERSWTFDGGVRYTVAFDKDGRSYYKEIAPTYCGVTPLIDKYVKE